MHSSDLSVGSTSSLSWQHCLMMTQMVVTLDGPALVQHKMAQQTQTRQGADNCRVFNAVKVTLSVNI
jgi:hypothetical protein